MTARIVSLNPSKCPYPIQETDWGWDDQHRLPPSPKGLTLNRCTLTETGEPVSALVDMSKGKVLLVLHGTPPDRSEEELIRFAALIEEVVSGRMVQPNPLPIY